MNQSAKVAKQGLTKVGTSVDGISSYTAMSALLLTAFGQVSETGLQKLDVLVKLHKEPCPIQFEMQLRQLI